jgi:ADP-ribosylglycohydrolase
MSDLLKARAILYGLALGDALGWPIEFLKMDKITIIYGEKGIQEPPSPALVTDDTQMSVAIADALVEAGEADIDTLMRAVTRRLIAWSNSPENTRAPGHTVTEAVRTLEAGVPWLESGIVHSKGNGSAIRVAPVGFLYQHDPARLREVSHATCIATHAHPTAIAATIAAAYVIKLALDGVSPVDYVDRTLEFVGDVPDDMLEAFGKVQRVSQWTDEAAAMEHFGAGWVAEEALAMAIYCAIRYEADFPGAVRRAVNIPGDSDSVGSLAGGLVAARHGLDVIPAEWIDRLENRDRLTDTAQRLAKKKQSLSGAAA